MKKGWSVVSKFIRVILLTLLLPFVLISLVFGVVGAWQAPRSSEF
jgi:hypothetical protein